MISDIKSIEWNIGLALSNEENMIIQILTLNQKEIVKLMADDQGSVQYIRIIPGPAIIECTTPIYLSKRMVGIPEVYNFVVTFSSGVAIGLFSNWLYEKLKGKSIVLRIESEEIDITKGAEEIEKVVRKKIEIRKE